MASEREPGVEVRVVPRGAARRCGSEHGIDMVAHDSGATTMRVCPCFKLTFPQNPRATSLLNDPTPEPGSAS